MKSQNTKWITVDSAVIFTVDPRVTAKSFFEILVEPYYEREPVCLDLRKFQRHETINFVKEIRTLSNNSDMIIFVHKIEK